MALARAKLAASSVHLIEARRLAAEGRVDEALEEYEIAMAYDPYNRGIAVEARALKGIEEKPIPERKKIELPVKLQVGDERIDLKFMREVSLRSIFQALGKYAQINILYDEQFRDIPFTIDLSDMTFKQALNILCLASKNFYRIIDERTVIVVPDQPVKRAQYEVNAIKTFYLSNITAQDIQVTLQQMLRTQFKAPTIIVDKNLNSVTIRDIPESLELADRIIRLWDKPKGEIVIDLEIMEVKRIKLQELGLDLDTHLVGLRYSGESESGWYDLSQIDFSTQENFQITIPAVFLKVLESDSDTKVIAQPRLRGVEGEEIIYIVGEEIPVPQTIVAPVAAGGVNQVPVTSYVYRNIGIDIIITPKIHQEREVTLEIELKLKSLSGTGFNDLPIFTTREVKNIIRLREGETNLLAGLLNDEERRTVKGIAGLKSIPVLGSLFSSSEKTIQQTDVIMTITPYILRSIPLTEKDSDPIWVNIKEPASTAAPRISQEQPLDPALERLRMQEGRQTESETAQSQVFLNPSNVELPQNREFRMSLNIRSEDEISNFSLDLQYNSQVVELKQVIPGGFVQQLGGEPSFMENIDNSSGVCTIGFSSSDIAKGFKGTGRIATLVFQTKAQGESEISFSSLSANATTAKALSFDTRPARIRVR
jgi:general secretion pathway protein D